DLPMAETKTLMTADDLFARPDDGCQYELVRGELIRMVPPGMEHGGVETRVVLRLGPHVYDNGLGELYTGDAGFKLESDPDTVRGPDVAFVRRDRLPAGAQTQGYGALAPALAIEIVSPSHRARDVRDELD